jgi:hypothetical protein
MKLRMTRWMAHVVYIGEIRIGHKILVGKPEGKTVWEV